MKKNIIVILMIIVSISTIYGDSIEEVIEKSKQLVEEKQYKTAMELLNNIDKDNSNKDVVIEKSRIFRTYFAQSLNHNMFGLKDLEENENLMDIRKNGGEFSLFIFDGIEILKKFLDTENGEVSNELGLYYYSIYLGYGDSLNEQYGNVLDLQYQYLNDAYKKFKYYDPLSWELLGKYYYGNKNVADAFNIMDDLVIKEPDNPEVNYTFGLMLFNNRSYDDAIPYVQTAIKYYQNEDYKYEAISMLGSLLYFKSNYAAAIEQFELALEYNPYEYRIYARYVDSLLKENKNEKARSYSTDILLIEPRNSYVASQLLPIFINNSELNTYYEILNNCLDETKGDILGEANFYFQQANVLIQMKEPQDRINNTLIISRDKYIEATNGEHQAIESINDYLDQH